MAYTQDSTTVNRKRLLFVTSGYATAYVGTMIGLNALWYADAEKSKFHWFNDNKEWNQVDKFGHALSAYHESKLITKSLLWAGVKPKNAAIYGGISGFLIQAPIELLDGYSNKWGASYGDLIANTAGALLAGAQYYFWSEYKIQFKFAFLPTRFPSERPNVLGENYAQQFFKDYNAQSYWLSTSVNNIYKIDKLPDWVAISVGYGAHEMIYGYETQNEAAGYRYYRQYFLSPDINFSSIPTNNKWIKRLFFLLDLYHWPFPALEYNRHDRLKFSFGK